MDEPAPRGKRPDVTSRRELRKGKETSFVQVGWASVCSNLEITKRIEDIIPEVARIRVERCLLNMHFIRLLEAGQDLPMIDQNLVGKAMQCIHSKRVSPDPELAKTFRDNYTPCCPNRPPSSCLPRISKILEDLRNGLITNLRNHVVVHLEARHRRFLDLELTRLIEAVPFFAVKKNRESCVRLLTRASLWDPRSSFAEPLPFYPRIRDTIPVGAQLALRRLIDEVRPRVGPLSVKPSSQPHLYLPWMWSMAKSFEAEGQRFFSPVPNASFSAPFIAITPTTLSEIMPKGGKRKSGLTLPDLFAVSRLGCHRKTFANRITTDGVTASVSFLVDKRPELATVTEVVPLHVH
jgi:hypothetical protein